MTTEDDTREWLEFELERTRKAALAEGRAEGREALLATARRMLEDGLQADAVAKYTGLSPEEVAGLQLTDTRPGSI